MAIAKVLVDRGLRSSDNDQIARHAASGRFVHRGRGSSEVCDHLAEQRTEEQEMHYGAATLSLLQTLIRCRADSTWPLVNIQARSDLFRRARDATVVDSENFFQSAFARAAADTLDTGSPTRLASIGVAMDFEFAAEHEGFRRASWRPRAGARRSRRPAGTAR